MKVLKILLILMLGLLPALLAGGVALLSYGSPEVIEHRPVQHDTGNPLLVRDEYRGLPYEFKMGFVEFDDEGYLVDDAQESALLADIGAYRPESDGFELIILFVHGWNHDAARNDENVGCFEEFLRGAAVMQAQYGKRSGKPRRVYGVFAGWPGVVYRNSEWQQATTFWGREAAIDRVAERGALMQLISRLSAIRNARGPARVMFVVVGHSLGGRGLYRSLRPLIQSAVANSDSSASQPRIADLAVMVNPALSADDHRTLLDLAESRTQADVAVPQFVIATSTSDSVLRREFRWSRYIGTMVRGDFGLKQEARTTALGVYAPYVTHRLSLREARPGAYSNPEGQARCHSMRFDELSLVNRAEAIQNPSELYEFENIVHYDAQGREDYRTTLTRATDSASPLMVVEVDGRIIPDHNDIFTAPFVDFIARMLNREFFRNPG